MSNQWWGYVHIDGGFQAKPYFGIRDIEEAEESDFVLATYGPFFASDRDNAITTIKRLSGRE